MMAFLLDAVRRNPYPLYALLRRVAPVLRLPRGVWALFDHDSVKRALQDPATFSSRAAPPGGAPLDWLIFLDPPRHSRLRALISRSFTPSVISALEPRIEALSHALLDQVIERGALDLVADFAERLPLLVIAELVGMPPADAGRVTAWSEAILRLGDTVLGGERAARAKTAYAAARQEMRGWLAGVLPALRASPRADLLSLLAIAEVDGERLTDDELLAFFQLLLLAGTETTTNLIANAVLCLFEHPRELARLRANPALLPAIIEEVLRFRSPAQLVFRATTREVVLHGRTIPAGALVLAVVGSANRDARQIPRAHRFEPSRGPTPHLAFGHGIHFCIAAALGRLEARVALAALFARLPDLRRAGHRGWTARPGLNVLGPRSLPLRFTPGARRTGPSV